MRSSSMLKVALIDGTKAGTMMTMQQQQQHPLVVVLITLWLVVAASVVVDVTPWLLQAPSRTGCLPSHPPSSVGIGTFSARLRRDGGDGGSSMSESPSSRRRRRRPRGTTTAGGAVDGGDPTDTPAVQTATVPRPSSRPKWDVSLVERVAAEVFDPNRDYFCNHDDDVDDGVAFTGSAAKAGGNRGWCRNGGTRSRPVLVERALSSEMCDLCSQLLLSMANRTYVDLQQQQQTQKQQQKQKQKQDSASSFAGGSSSSSSSSSITSKVIEGVRLDRALDVLMTRSDSKTSYLCFCEGLLLVVPSNRHDGGSFNDDDDHEDNDCDDDSNNHHREDDKNKRTIQTLVTDARERLFNNRPDNAKNRNNGGGQQQQAADPDWFTLFPMRHRPQDAVLFSGVGATSTLHRDPFEWTGTNLCLEGTKVWRLLEPIGGDVAAVDAMLRSVRLESVAWNSDGEGGEEGGEEDALLPLPTSLSAGWQADSRYSLYHGRDHAVLPTARDLAELADEPEGDDDEGPARRDRALVDELFETTNFLIDVLVPNLPTTSPPSTSAPFRIHTVLQRPGDMVLIPAHWWHQTYTLEPCVAVASQRCGTHDAERVLQHVLDHHRHRRATATASTSSSSARRGPTTRNGNTTVGVTSARTILDTAESAQAAVDSLFAILKQQQQL